MSRRKKSDDSIIIWAILIGIPAFLIVEYPIIFWLVFIPLVILGAVKFIAWLKK